MPALPPATRKVRPPENLKYCEGVPGVSMLTPCGLPSALGTAQLPGTFSPVSAAPSAQNRSRRCGNFGSGQERVNEFKIPTLGEVAPSVALESALHLVHGEVAG
jgi:hypothetical protein